MRYYVTADVHGFYTEMQQALETAGYYTDPEPHKLIILGDFFDRGREAKEMQQFLLDQMEQESVILIRGNHEDLFQDLVTVDEGLPYSHHISNGTFDTALQLTGFTPFKAQLFTTNFITTAQETPYYQQIIPATIDYYETDNYLFVHGWVPCHREPDGYSPNPDWRNAEPQAWREARWCNGIEAVRTCRTEKTVLCGHWHCSYGHAKYEHRGSDYGADADFSPYYAPGIIALDACTALSRIVNVVVIED